VCDFVDTACTDY